MAARHAAATGAPGTTTDTFTLTVFDGHGGAVDVPVTVKIRALNSAPDDAKATVTQPDTATGGNRKDQCRRRGRSRVKFAAHGDHQKGSGSVAADGTFTYTRPRPPVRRPAPQRPSSSTKTDRIHVTVSDGHGGTDTVSVKVKVPTIATQVTLRSLTRRRPSEPPTPQQVSSPAR